MSPKQRKQFGNRIHNLVVDLAESSRKVDEKEGESSSLAYLLNDTLTHLENAYTTINKTYMG